MNKEDASKDETEVLESVKLEFKTIRYKHAMIIQQRMMELMVELRHDKLIEENEDDDEYDEDDEDSPASSELYSLMELYRVIIEKVGNE